MVVDHAGGLHEGVDDGGADDLNPRDASSFDILIDSGVDAGTLAVVLKWLTFGWPSTKSQMNFENPGPSSMIFR